MRDTTKLHPVLQQKIAQLIAECAKQGIKIKISECVRTVAEQDALYAKGRTAPGSIVTNCKGSNYRSMHQWGVAFDFFLDMDVDGDGKTSDDAYNNSTKLFNKVGAIGQKLGLEWGGSWKSIVDTPHFQLPDWGSTATQLINKYGTPEKFFKTWAQTTPAKTETKSTTTKTTTTAAKAENPTPASKSKEVVTPASKANKAYAGTYKVTAKSGLNMRNAANGSSVLVCVPKDAKVICYKYYDVDKSNNVWYFVEYGKYTGYVLSTYCAKVK